MTDEHFKITLQILQVLTPKFLSNFVSAFAGYTNRWPFIKARVGKGAGVLGARGAKKRRPPLGRGRYKISGALTFRTATQGFEPSYSILFEIGISTKGLGSFE